MAISISRRGKIPGSKPSSCKIPPIPITTGTSASPPSATRPIPSRAFSTPRVESNGWSITTPRSVSTSARPCSPGWKPRAPDVYLAILEADRESQKHFSGHGSALAQAYNHMIMPLANSRDRRTQVLWGIADFEHRFKRKPEGMWLPETAVDIETSRNPRRDGNSSLRSSRRIRPAACAASATACMARC